MAKSAGDPKYLATVCRDIAQSLMTDMGRAGCAAQDEVLQYCDRLFVTNKITENQLLYMRHMVLIRDDVVATLYDDFQRHRSPERFAMELFRLANTHPRWIDGSEDEDEEDKDEEEQEGGSDDDDDESERVLSSAVHPDDGDENRAAVLTGIVNLMSRAGGLTANESGVLRRLIQNDNDYVTAAYELFQQDGDVEELEDTLLRISRLEIARNEANESSIRSAARQEATAAAARVDSRRTVNPFGREAQHAAQAGYYQDEQVDDDDDEDEESSSGSESSSEREQEEEDTRGAQKYVENFLAGLGVRNTWDSSVPERFIVAVFATAQKGLLTIGQARALCDLYQARYDLVLAAWEVFTVQGDVPDLMDTLLRIVRGLNFNSSGELVESKSMIEGNASESSSSEEGSEESESEEDQPPARQPVSDEARREVAVRAVAQAKHDLLRHSLDMMVKQGIAPADKAAVLFQRALEGDLLVDAAIEAYANDRNVADFLDTLNILLTHSPAELENIMQSAMARQGGSNAPQGDSTGRMPVGAPPAQRDSSGGQVAPRFPAPPTAPSSAAEVEDPDLDAAQLQLREIVSELGDRDILSPAGKTILVKLIITRDDRVLGAHDEYRESGELGDLVDSLIRIARLEQAAPSPASGKGGSGKASEDAGIEMASFKKPKKSHQDSERGFEMTDLGHGDGAELSDENLQHYQGQAPGIHPLSRAGSMDSLPSSPATASVTKSPASAGKDKPSPLSGARDSSDVDGEGDDDDESGKLPLLTVDDQQSILDILNNAGALSNLQYAALLRLLKVGDRRLGVVFQQYEQDKDVHGLIARLGDVSKMLVDMLNEEADEDEAESSEGSNKDDQWDEEDDDDDEEEEDELDEVFACSTSLVYQLNLFCFS